MITESPHLDLNRAARIRADIRCLALLMVLHATVFYVEGRYFSWPGISYGKFYIAAEVLAFHDDWRETFRKENLDIDEPGPTIALAALYRLTPSIWWGQRVYRLFLLSISQIGIALLYLAARSIGLRRRLTLMTCCLYLLLPYPHRVAFSPTSFAGGIAFMTLFYGILSKYIAIIHRAGRAGSSVELSTHVRHGLAMGLSVGLASIFRSQSYLLSSFLFPAMGLFLYLVQKSVVRWRVAFACICIGFGSGQLLGHLPGMIFFHAYQGTIQVRRNILYHSIALGLAYDGSNGLGMKSGDEGVRDWILVRYPEVGYCSPEYERVLSQVLICHLKTNPFDFARSFLHRLSFLVHSIPTASANTYDFGFRLINIVCLMVLVWGGRLFWAGRFPEFVIFFGCFSYYFLTVTLIQLPHWAYLWPGHLAMLPAGMFILAIESEIT